MKMLGYCLVVVSGLVLAGCSGLHKDMSRQEKYLLGGAALGATVLSISTVGAPGATTAVIGGAILGTAAGYMLETVTRPGPPGAFPAQSTGRVDAEVRLRELIRLRDAQLISAHEYESRRRIVLDTL